MANGESHRAERITWLRAAVLGANDGLISTGSLVVGFASAQATHHDVLLAALAGLVAGALSMAAGEYVSVSSQADSERADLARERQELAANPASEHAELAAIYVARGLTPNLAVQVADQLTAHDPIGAHARDELGLSEGRRARPLQVALASASAFAVGAALPLLLVALAPTAILTPIVMGGSLVLLTVLGGTAARLGGAPMARGAARVAFWGAVAMGCTALVGKLFGATRKKGPRVPDAFMRTAIEEAEQGLREGGIPIGSVLVHGDRIIGRGHNRRVQRGSAVLHGEMDALENAGRQPAAIYRASVIYTTLSPCAMCSGAILLYGIPRVVVGENRTFLGEEALLRSRGVEVDVRQDATCIALMTAFIRDHPGLWNEDIGVEGT